MENNGQIELSEVMKDPEMAKQIKEIIAYVEKTPFSKMFPKKYENSIKRIAIEETYQLFKNNPTMPLKSVVTTVLNKFKEDMSPDLLLKMTRLIIQEWENASTAIYNERDMGELV